MAGKETLYGNCFGPILTGRMISGGETRWPEEEGFD